MSLKRTRTDRQWIRAMSRTVLPFLPIAIRSDLIYRPGCGFFKRFAGVIDQDHRARHDPWRIDR